MIKELIKLATHLDEKGLFDEANALDKIAGDLVNLDQFRKLKSEEPQASEPPTHSDEWKALTEDVFSGEEDLDKLIDIVVLDDGETWAGDASIVSLTQEEMDRVDDGEKVYNVVDPDHGAPGSKWRDVWETCFSES